MTITRAVYNHLDSLPACEFSGWQLFEAIHEATGRSPYPTTLIQIAREYCDITGGELECIDHNKSRYKFTPCARLGRAIIDYKINME